MLSAVLRIGTAFFGALTLVASCGEEPLAPTAGDRVPEVSVSGSRLVRDFTAEGDYLISPSLLASDRATRVGFMVDMKLDRMNAPARFEARGIDRYGRAGEWIPAELTWR